MLAKGVAKRELPIVDETYRRRGMADEVSAGCGVCSCGTTRIVLRSVRIREGPLNLDSSSLSSPTVFLRLRTNKEVLRPSSGSSVPARLVLRRSDDVLPSSGSSVPARRALENRREDLLLEIGSIGVDGIEVDARDVGRELPLRMLSLLSSNLDMVLGLVTASLGTFLSGLPMLCRR